MTPPKTERNQNIIKDKRAGKTVTELMQIYNITRRRINYIILRETKRPRRRVKKMIPDNTQRDLKLVQEYKDGYSFQEIADMNELSKQRVGAIVRTIMGKDYVRQYKTNEKHREGCSRRYKEKGRATKPVKIDPEVLWYRGHKADMEACNAR